VKVQTSQAEEPFKKLRKQLKAFPSNPKPKDVHSLRTQTRRLEATVAALALDHKKQSRDLMELMKPVRKAAGKVRDMDVLIGYVLGMAEKSDEKALRLVEHLAKMRAKHARRLQDLIKRRRRGIRDCLKSASNIVCKKVKSDGLAAEAGPQILMTELSHWPELNKENLHPFRIRVKALRYMLQLSQEADAGLLKALGEVKDAIGEWHDWVELLKIAGAVLDPASDRLVLKRIEDTGRAKLVAGLGAANNVRQRYFRREEGRKAKRKILPVAP
jgi:CHAD domain-containing protein